MEKVIVPPGGFAQRESVKKTMRDQAKVRQFFLARAWFPPEAMIDPSFNSGKRDSSPRRLRPVFDQVMCAVPPLQGRGWSANRHRKITMVRHMSSL